MSAKGQLADLPRAMEVEDVADTVGENTRVDSRGSIGPRAFPVSGLCEEVVKGEVSHKDAGARASNALKRLSGVLECFIYCFKDTSSSAGCSS